MPAMGFYRYEYRHNTEKLEENMLFTAMLEECCALGAWRRHLKSGAGRHEENPVKGRCDRDDGQFHIDSVDVY